MRSSKFCVHIVGDTPSASRLFHAIVSACIPVIISDAIDLPMESAINYARFSLFFREQVQAPSRPFTLCPRPGLGTPQCTPPRLSARVLEEESTQGLAPEAQASRPETPDLPCALALLAVCRMR